MKKSFSFLIILSTLFINNTGLRAMDMKAVHDLFSQSAQESSSQKSSSMPSARHFDFEDKIKEVIKDKFYVGKIKDKDLYGVMERVSDENQRDWLHYAFIQRDSRIVSYARGYMKTFTSDGSGHFKNVLENVSYDANELWIAYLTNNQHPTYIPDKFKNYLITDVESVIDKKPTPEALNVLNLKIKIFVTVISSPKALVTSHMGISKTVESIFNRDTYKDISMDLHAFAAKVMLLKNPQRILMLTAPATAMRNIIAKNLPANKVFVSTKEVLQTIDKRDHITVEQFKDDNYLMSQFNEEYELLKRFKENLTLDEYFKKYKSYYDDVFDLQDYINPVTAKDFYLTMSKKHPPIISVDAIRTMKDRMTFYNPKNLDKPLFTITSKSPDYQWLNAHEMKPNWACPYVAVDLPALAECRQLESMDKNEQRQNATDIKRQYEEEQAELTRVAKVEQEKTASISKKVGPPIAPKPTHNASSKIAMSMPITQISTSQNKSLSSINTTASTFTNDEDDVEEVLPTASSGNQNQNQDQSLNLGIFASHFDASNKNDYFINNNNLNMLLLSFGSDDAIMTAIGNITENNKNFASMLIRSLITLTSCYKTNPNPATAQLITDLINHPHAQLIQKQDCPAGSISKLAAQVPTQSNQKELHDTIKNFTNARK